jgi:DNA-binding PadR family transcriptional regulator
MNETTRQILRMFKRFNKESLDLHELFEAGGNDPEGRKEVFYAVERMVEDGLLEERGNDFYALTDAGREAAGREVHEPEPEEGEVGYF